jgi:hypothetical protein
VISTKTLHQILDFILGERQDGSLPCCACGALRCNWSLWTPRKRCYAGKHDPECGWVVWCTHALEGCPPVAQEL